MEWCICILLDYLFYNQVLLVCSGTKMTILCVWYNVLTLGLMVQWDTQWQNTLSNWCSSWLIANYVCYGTIAGGMSHSQVSNQLKTVTSAAYSMKAALNTGFCILYWTSRQSFVWGQCFNVIFIHSIVVHCQSSWSHYKAEQNKKWLLILSLAVG